MSKQTALFIDGPAIGRKIECPDRGYPISIPVATRGAQLVAHFAHDDRPTHPAHFEKVEYYEARTRDLPFGMVFYSLYPVDQQGWERGVKMLEIVVQQDREEFEKNLNVRVSLAEKRVAELTKEVSDFRWTMSKLTGALTLALGGMSEDA